MVSSKSKQGNTDPTVYDFENEKRIYMILGGFVLVKRPMFYYVLNILWLLFFYALYPFLLITALITYINYTLEKNTSVELLHNMSLSLAIPGLSAIGNLTRSRHSVALKHFRSGVFLYQGETNEISRIKKKYVDLFRKLVPLLYTPIFAFALLKTFLSPVLHLVSVKADVGKDSLNPFLPLRQYVPFNTRTPLGFGAAFFLHAMFFFCLNVTFTCHVETYVGSAIQFTAQLEILSYTLRSIEKRAQSKLAEGKTRPNANADNLSDYENCLLSCLKENIQHHHAILRLSKFVSPYIEWTGSLSIIFFSVLLAAAATLALKDPAGNVELIFFVILALIGYFTMCGVGQMITDMSCEVRDSLYTIPWPLCGKKFRVILGIMMANTKNPLVLHAKLFGNDISLENFANMTSLAYKLVSILR